MPHVLVVTTSHARLGESDRATGLWLEELATPWYAMQDAGLQLTLASTAGGAVPIDPGSLKPRGENDASVERALADPAMQARLAASSPVSELQGQRFDAVFLPGGHGTMWDLPTHEGLIALLHEHLETGGVLAAVCHGPAGLVGLRQPDGTPWVMGRRLAAFSDAEEQAVGLTDTVPFLLASRLRELGAEVVDGPNFAPQVVVDGRWISGQNPASSQGVAEALIELLAR